MTVGLGGRTYCLPPVNLLYTCYLTQVGRVIMSWIPCTSVHLIAYSVLHSIPNLVLFQTPMLQISCSQSADLVLFQYPIFRTQFYSNVLFQTLMLPYLPPSLTGKGTKHTVYLSDVFAVVPGTGKQARGSTAPSQPTQFTLHVLRCQPGCAGLLEQFLFKCPNSETCQAWAQQIHHQRQSEGGREGGCLHLGEIRSHNTLCTLCSTCLLLCR